MLGSLHKASKAAAAVRAKPLPLHASLSKSLKVERNPGTFGSLYKGAVLASLLNTLKNEDKSATTFLNVLGGGAGSQLKMTHLNRDAMLLYRWLRLPLGLREVPANIHLLKPYLKQFEAANHNVEEDEHGFPKTLYLPSENSMIYSVMSPVDRAVIHEDDAAAQSTSQELMGHDQRVSLPGPFPDADDNYMIRMLPFRGRGFVWFDLGLVPTYKEQMRVRNIATQILQNQPETVMGFCYPAPMGRLPWSLLEIIQNTGNRNAWNSVHFADDTTLDRAAALTLDSTRSIEAEIQAQFENFSQTGSFGARGGYTPRMPELYDQTPATLRQLRPEPNWVGTGITLVNAPDLFETELSEIGSVLKEILGKPDGSAHKQMGPVYPKEQREVGEAYRSISLTIPGFSMDDNMQKIHPADLDRAHDKMFTSDAINILSALNDSRAPQHLDQILQDATDKTKVSTMTRQVIYPSNLDMARNEAYVKGDTPMSRIVTDLEMYQLGRQAHKRQVDAHRADNAVDVGAKKARKESNNDAKE